MKKIMTYQDVNGKIHDSEKECVAADTKQGLLNMIESCDLEDNVDILNMLLKHAGVVRNLLGPYLSNGCYVNNSNHDVRRRR